MTFQDQHRAHRWRCSLDNNFVEANDLGRETLASAPRTDVDDDTVSVKTENFKDINTLEGEAVLGDNEIISQNSLVWARVMALLSSRPLENLMVKFRTVLSRISSVFVQKK